MIEQREIRSPCATRRTSTWKISSGLSELATSFRISTISERDRASVRAWLSSRPTRRCAFTRASSSRTRNGFAMKSLAPRPRERTVASSGGMLEIMRTGRSWYFGSVLTRWRSCSPSTFGIMMSRRRRSNWSEARCSKRCSPPGMATTSYPFSLRIQERVRESAWSSSATRILGASTIQRTRRSKMSGSTLPPLAMATTVPGDLIRPARSAAVAAAPDGSTRSPADR